MYDELSEGYHQLVGHDAQITQAQTSFRSGKMHHAWLLTGPSGIGKSLFARQLAAAIIASDTTQSAFFEDKPAFSLRFDPQNATMRQVMHHAHPDFHYIAPIEDEKNKSGAIKVEQIRSLTPFLSHKSATSGWRVAIIDHLDAVNVQGANAMLKMVEEPPEKTVIILIASAYGIVLPTIRSRCRHLKFDPLSQQDQQTILSAHLPEADQASLAQLALFSGGSIGYALEVAQTDALDLYEASCLILAKPQADTNALMQLSGKWGAVRNKALLPIAAQAFSRLLATAALTAAGAALPQTVMAQEKALISSLAEGSDAATIAAFHQEFLASLSKGVHSYLDMQSVFMKLFDKIHSLAHPK